VPLHRLNGGCSQEKNAKNHSRPDGLAGTRIVP
jgi:hypothetical protein